MNNSKQPLPAGRRDTQPQFSNPFHSSPSQIGAGKDARGHTTEPLVRNAAQTTSGSGTTTTIAHEATHPTRVSPTNPPGSLAPVSPTHDHAQAGPSSAMNSAELDWSFVSIRNNQAALGSFSQMDGSRPLHPPKTPPNSREGPLSFPLNVLGETSWSHRVPFNRPTSQQIGMCFQKLIAQAIEAKLVNPQTSSLCLCKAVFEALRHFAPESYFLQLVKTPYQLQVQIRQLFTNDATEALYQALEGACSPDGSTWLREDFENRPLCSWISQYVEILGKDINALGICQFRRPPELGFPRFMQQDFVPPGPSHGVPHNGQVSIAPPTHGYNSNQVQDDQSIITNPYSSNPSLINLRSQEIISEPSPTNIPTTCSQSELLHPRRKSDQPFAESIRTYASSSQEDLEGGCTSTSAQHRRASPRKIQTKGTEENEHLNASIEPTEPPRRESWLRRSIRNSIQAFVDATKPRHAELARADSIWAPLFMPKREKNTAPRNTTTSPKPREKFMFKLFKSLRRPIRATTFQRGRTMTRRAFAQTPSNAGPVAPTAAENAENTAVEGNSSGFVSSEFTTTEFLSSSSENCNGNGNGNGDGEWYGVDDGALGNEPLIPRRHSTQLERIVGRVPKVELLSRSW